MAAEPTIVEREGANFFKFFSGLFNPTTHLKLVAFIVIAVIWLLVGTGIYNVYKMFTKKADAPVANVSPSRVSGASTITSSGGAVSTTTNEMQETTSHATTTSTNVTYQPFANGIFGPFGSWFKQQGNDVKEVRHEEV